MYNSCAARDKDPYWLRRAYLVQIHFWEDDVTRSYEENTKAAARNKGRLKIIRDLVTKKLTSIAPLIDMFHCEMDSLRSEGYKTTTKIFVKRMKSVSKKCNRLMVQHAGDIIRQADEMCGAPPCRFAAVGLGSMAREETTPYSDLEFLFSVENNNSLAHFQRLGVTVFFTIGNLQETDLKYMNIEELNRDGKWFSDASVSGFKIDGLHEKAGNIPTGNGTGDCSPAMDHHQKALYILLKIHGDSPHPDIAASYNNIGDIYRSKGDYSSAMNYYQKSVTMQLKIHGDYAHIDIAASYNNVGTVYKSQGDYSSAMDYHQKALYIQLKMHGDSPHPDIATSYINIGNVYRSKGDYSSAMDYYQKAFEGTYNSPLAADLSKNMTALHGRMEELIIGMVSFSSSLRTQAHMSVKFHSSTL